jgi:hypothetical protein
LHVAAVVNLGAAAAESMAARFQLPGAPRDESAMEAVEDREDGPADGDTAP